MSSTKHTSSGKRHPKASHHSTPTQSRSSGYGGASGGTALTLDNRTRYSSSRGQPELRTENGFQPDRRQEFPRLSLTELQTAARAAHTSEAGHAAQVERARAAAKNIDQDGGTSPYISAGMVSERLTEMSGYSGALPDGSYQARDSYTGSSREKRSENERGQTFKGKGKGTMR